METFREPLDALGMTFRRARPDSSLEVNQIPTKGALDGVTILRFAHAFEGGGGVENHLADLNRELSRRHTLTTIQMRLTRRPDGEPEFTENVSGSRIIHHPLTLAAPSSALLADAADSEDHSRERVLNALLPTRTLNALCARTVMRWRRIPRRTLEAEDAGRAAAELIRRFNVDLVVLHSSGGRDASEVIAAARHARLPILLVHHFANVRLGGMSIRQQAASVAAVGGASAVAVPAYLRHSFHNLSDAVDLNFYDPRHASPPRHFALPMLYAPGRVTPDKGQMDALQVAARLRRRGIATTLVFAGRVDSASFERRLRDTAVREGLGDSVEFLGELTLQQYRNWFRAARLFLMPTRHHEGMPRTLIDSQAMRVPPIVYDIGGTREGVRHGGTGFLVRVGDVDAMAEAAERLVLDDALHQRMADAGRRFVEENFSLAALAARHEEFYLKALKSHVHVGMRRRDTPAPTALA